MTIAEQSSGRAGRIEPLLRLATGGMAEIWLAREQGAAGLERFVVIKRLLPHLANDPSIVDMFVSEARFVARLVHPNVVQIHELGEDADGYFLVMEYVEGCTVRELMSAARREARPLDAGAAICIIEQACRGAHAAHELGDSSGNSLGLVHRDISPHNLMIGPGGDVKLLDFGIAKATALAEATRTGSLKGKCTYMSPEQCQGQSIDRRSDIFSMGIVLWELLVGQRLFQRDSEFASMDAIVSGDIPLPSEECPGLPVALDAVVAKALAKEKDERWQTADALRRALVAAGDEAGVRPSRDALDTTLHDLLGEKLATRQRALRDTSTLTEADHAALQEALVGSNPRAHHSVSKVSRTKSHADDAPTVVQRRSTRPPADEPDEDTLARTKHDLGAHSSRPPPSDIAVGELESNPPDFHAPDPLAMTAPIQLVSRAKAPVASVQPVAEGAPTTERSPDDAPPPRSAGGSTVVIAALAALAATAALVWFFALRSPTPESGVSSATPAPVLTGPPMTFAVAPTVETDVLKKEMAPLARWMEQALGRPVRVEVTQSYDDCGRRVADGRADLGLLPPLLYVQTKAREPNIQALAIRLYEGSRGSDGYLLVRDDKPLKSAKGLRGRTVCLVDRESTTGYLLPRIWMRDNEIDPDTDIKTVLSGDHLKAMRDLADKKCDAAAVYSGAYLSARQQGISVGTLRMHAVTGRVPQDVVAASPKLAKEQAAELAQLFVGFDPERDVGSKLLGEVLGISGFAAFEKGEFDLIRKAAEGEDMLNPR